MPSKELIPGNVCWCCDGAVADTGVKVVALDEVLYVRGGVV